MTVPIREHPLGKDLSEGEHPAALPDQTGPHAPDGTPIDLAGLRGKRRAGAAAAVVGAMLRFAQRLKSLFESDHPEPPGATERPSEPPGDPLVQRGTQTEQNKGAQPGKPDNGTKSPDQTPSAVTRGFAGRKSFQKWQNQMRDRGWTAQQFEEAVQDGERHSAENRVNPGNGATRYVHRQTGRSVIIDDTTGQVIQIGGDGFGHD